MTDFEELRDKLLAATKEGHDGDTVFSALQSVMFYWMVMLCKDCRTRIAREFKTEIPKMLAAANQFAAANPDLQRQHEHHH